MDFTLINGKFLGAARLMWAPTLTYHDPNPPMSLETPVPPVGYPEPDSPKTEFGVTWKELRIGAGGWITGIDIAHDGTKVCRTDTYGAYIWNGTTWLQMVSSKSMPAEYIPIGRGDGVWEIRIAPSLTTRFYMNFKGNVFRSDDRGATWQVTAFPVSIISANDGYRYYGQKMAIDPHNPDVVYCGSPSRGMYVTYDGGQNWSAVVDVGATAAGPGYAIAFDPASPVAGGRTQGIFISRYETGVYHSTNGGTTFSLTSGTPTTHVHMTVSNDGHLHLARRDQFVNVYYQGVWTQKATNSLRPVWSIAINPANQNHIVICDDAGALNISVNNGATWTGYQADVTTASDPADIPWLAWPATTYMATGDIAFDPAESNTLYMSAGIGVWYTAAPTAVGPVTWNSRSHGIEQLIPRRIVSPPGATSKPVITALDRPLWVLDNPDVYPSKYDPPSVRPETNGVVHGYDVDYASSDPLFLAALCNNHYGALVNTIEHSGYSTDGGATWLPWPSKPAHVTNSYHKHGGCMAAATPLNILWFPTLNSPGYYTLDGGVTWNEVNIPGVSNDPAGLTGWGWATWFRRFILAADRVNIGTFYAYNMITNDVPSCGLYRTVDGGVNWTKIHERIGDYSRFNTMIKSVPGRAGWLYYTQGALDGVLPGWDLQPFYRSTNGGETWTEVPNVKTVFDFGFGKAPPGWVTPALYIIGFVNTIFGVYVSLDNAATWTRIGSEYIINKACFIPNISGDMNVFGRVYVGLTGTGWAYGDASDALVSVLPGEEPVFVLPPTVTVTVSFTSFNELLRILGEGTHNLTFTGSLSAK